MKLNAKLGKSAAWAAVLAATLFLLFSGLGCNTPKNTAGVMATVNGRKIQRAEVDKNYNNLHRTIEKLLKPFPPPVKK